MRTPRDRIAEELGILYERAKQEQWNASERIEWGHEVNPDKGIFEDGRIPIFGTPLWEKLDEEERGRLNRNVSMWRLSQIILAEEAGYIICGKEIADIASMHGVSQDATLFLGTQAVDEARHVEVFSRYFYEKLGGELYSISPNLKRLVHLIGAQTPWYCNFLGLQIITESIALASFSTTLESLKDPLMKQITRYVIGDEARHTKFGIQFLKLVVLELTEKEREEAADFCFEAVQLATGRYYERRIYEELFSDEEIEEISKISAEGEYRKEFLRKLGAAATSALQQTGFITDRIRPHYVLAGFFTGGR